MWCAWAICVAVALSGCSWLNSLPTEEPHICAFTDNQAVCEEAWAVSDRALKAVFNGVVLIQDARRAGDLDTLRLAVGVTSEALTAAYEVFEIIGRDTAPLDQAKRVLSAAVGFLSV